eukprot:712033-Pyramimonas_sp.AAC.1
MQINATRKVGTNDSILRSWRGRACSHPRSRGQPTGRGDRNSLLQADLVAGRLCGSISTSTLSQTSACASSGMCSSSKS